jgi:hypothetical protein
VEELPATETNERRQHQRYNVELRIQVIGSNFLPMHVQTSDLSADGMHFNCDRATAQQLMPPTENGTPAPAKSFTIRFKLPVDSGKSRTLTVFTKVIDTQQLAKDLYRVNMRFVRFGGKSRADFDNYLAGLQPVS